MLATRGTTVPAGAGWAHEVKWDGVRVLADTAGAAGGVRLSSRNEHDITVAWPDVALAAAAGRDLLVDGEVIALDAQGLPNFRTLQERLHVRRAGSAARLAERVPATFMVFDLLRLDGRDLTAEPWSARAARGPGPTRAEAGWQVPPVYDDGAMLLEATRAQGLEGVVSKRRDARYAVGARSPHWVKLAHRHRGSYVVGGWRAQEGTGAAAPAAGRAARRRAHAGRAGLPRPRGQRDRPAPGPRPGGGPAPLAARDSPFVDEVPALDARGTHWVEPVLVVDVDTHGLGYARLRQPSFRGLREDLRPEDLAGGSA